MSEEIYLVYDEVANVYYQATQAEIDQAASKIEHPTPTPEDLAWFWEDEEE